MKGGGKDTLHPLGGGLAVTVSWCSRGTSAVPQDLHLCLILCLKDRAVPAISCPTPASALHLLILFDVSHPFLFPSHTDFFLFQFDFVSMFKKSSPSTANPPGDRASIPPHRHTSSSTTPPKTPSSPASTSKRVSSVTSRPASTGTQETKAKVRRWDAREAKAASESTLKHFWQCLRGCSMSQEYLTCCRVLAGLPEACQGPFVFFFCFIFWAAFCCVSGNGMPSFCDWGCDGSAPLPCCRGSSRL